MTALSRLSESVRIALAVFALLLAIGILVYLSQLLIERDALSPAAGPDLKEAREIDKLSAEVRQIRSDTGGSLFWLKMLGVLVTVGGAVGGYLVGQSRSTRRRIEFEDRKKVDELYQQMVVELSSESELLRAAAAVKLGELLRAFPEEWQVAESRRDELIQLTKQVLAASLAIETEDKVLKTLTIQIVLHHPWAGDPMAVRRAHPWNGAPAPPKEDYGDLRGGDLSNAKANDAYWAKVDFSFADFYRAHLRGASFRDAILHGAQFRETCLEASVLSGADCEKANFKLADLRKANLTQANLTGATFEAVDLRGADLTDATLAKATLLGAKVHGTVLTGAKLDEVQGQVDVSPKGNESKVISAREWASAAR
jgi:hypothetical protein